MLKAFDDLDILGVTFNSKMNFEKHLLSVSRAASQRLDLVYLMIYCSLLDTFGVLSSFWSAVLRGDALQPILNYWTM